jgi:hypothetical protein
MPARYEFADPHFRTLDAQVPPQPVLCGNVSV